MFNKKTKLKLTDFECNLLINGMNEYRNMLLSDGIPTEDIDELLVKIINKCERYRNNKLLVRFVIWCYNISEVTDLWKLKILFLN